MEGLIGKMHKAMSSNPNPEESIHSLQLILGDVKKTLNSTERNCRVAFAQLVGYEKADMLLSNYTEMFEWKVQLDLTPLVVFQVEEKLQNLLNSFVTENPMLISTKVRGGRGLDLILGLSLPHRERKEEDDIPSPRRVKHLLSAAGTSEGKATIRSFVQQMETELRRHELEVRLRQNELDLYRDQNLVSPLPRLRSELVCDQAVTRSV